MIVHAPCANTGPPPCEVDCYGGEAQIFDGVLSKVCLPEPVSPCKGPSCEQKLTEARNALHSMMVLNQPAAVTSASGTVQYVPPTPSRISTLQGYIRELESECGASDPCPPPCHPCDPCGGQHSPAYNGRGPLSIRFH